MAESLFAEAVGVASELSEVREPGVGAFDGPTQAHGVWRLRRRRLLAVALGLLLGADDVGDPEAVAALRGQVAVVAAVQVQGLNIEE